MKLIKPNKIAFMQRTYGLGEDYYYVISPVLFFDLETSQILVENIQWKKVNEALGQDALDHALPKAKAEFLVTGHAYASTNDTRKMDVRIDFVTKTKILKIFGPRQWQRNRLGQLRQTEPEIFSKTALNYQNAYGGENCPTNPEGSGFEKDSILPLIEDPDKPTRKPRQKRLPAGTMPLPINWPQRAEYQGDYGDDWFEKHFPALPESTNLQLFNTAPKDQQFENFLTGDEHYQLQGMLPNGQVLSGQLPKIKTRSFIQHSGNFSEVPLVLDTVWFMPDQKLGALIFRGQIQIANAEADEISQAMLAFENLADKPKNIGHYQQVMQLRTDPETANAHTMNESQLTPLKNEQEISERQAKLDAQQKKKISDIKAQQELELENLSDKLDISQVDLPEPQLSPFDQILDEDLENGDIDLTPVIQQVDQQIKQLQKDGDKKIAELDKNNNVDNKKKQELISLEKALEDFDCLKIKPESREFMPDLSEQEIQAMQLQQLNIQQMAISPKDKANRNKGVARALRELVIQSLTDNQSLSAKNLSAADLSELNFKNIDFNHSIFSFCQLEKTKFINCVFNEAAFINTEMTNCEFTNCVMKQCNLSGSKGSHIKFEDCDLSLSLWRANELSTMCISKCDFKQAQFFDNKFNHSRFIECHLLQNIFSGCQLNDCDFQKCDINQTTFSESTLDMTRWYDSKLERSIMQCSPMRLASFIGAKLNKVVFSVASQLTRANFSFAEINQSSFRTAIAHGLISNNAIFKQCDFSEANLTASRFNRCQIIQCIAAGTNYSDCNFNDCNCYKSRFRKAIFSNSSLKKVNMLEADLMWAQFQDTSLTGCSNLSRVALKDLKNRKKQNMNENKQCEVEDEQTRIA